MPTPPVEPKSTSFGTAPDCPVRVGETTREAIVARFGTPTFSSQHFLACGYYCTTKVDTSTGLHMGACIVYFGTIDALEDDDVWLEFDSHGVLKRCEKHLIDPLWGDSEKAWRQFTKGVLDSIFSGLDQTVSHFKDTRAACGSSAATLQRARGKGEYWTTAGVAVKPELRWWP